MGLGPRAVLPDPVVRVHAATAAATAAILDLLQRHNLSIVVRHAREVILRECVVALVAVSVIVREARVGLHVVRQSFPARNPLAQLELRSFADLDEDADVQSVHDRQREVKVEESCHGFEDRVFGILRVTHIRRDGPVATVSKVVPPGDGDDPQRADHPHKGDHAESPFARAFVQVLERRAYGPVAVQAEDEEVKNGGGGCCVVYADPDLANGHAKGPAAREDVDG